MRRLGKRGDTIIEVLIVIAVIGMVLASAYVSTNSSLNATRQSQERVEATKLAETQIERLKVVAADKNSDVFSRSNFCINEALEVITSNNIECAQQPQEGVDFSIDITRPTNGSDQTFTTQVKWSQLGTAREETVSIVYRIQR